jgi:hypothetical protein
MRLLRLVALFLLPVMAYALGNAEGSLWGDARAAEAPTLERRIRISATFRDLPEINRETAVATFGHALRARAAGDELRMHLLDLVDSDAALAATLRARARGDGLDGATDAAIRRYLDLPLDYIDPKIGAIAAQIERLERKMGPNPPLAPIPDRELIDALGGLTLAHEQLARLHDLRAQLTDGPVAAMALTGGGWTRLLAERERLARRASQARLDLLGMREQHQLQLQLLTRGLGKTQLRRELDEANTQFRLLQAGTGKLNAQARDLVAQRRALLTGYLASLDSAVGTGSRLLAPAPAGMQTDSPLLAEWEVVRGELTRSVVARGQAAAKLLPVLRSRNRQLTALFEAAGGDGDDLALMRLLVGAEDKQLEAFAAFHKRTGSAAGGREAPTVDLGIALDTLQLLETQVVTTMVPFLGALIDGTGQTSDKTLAPRMRELARQIEAATDDLTGLAALAAREQGIWERYDAWLAELMRQRIRFWNRARGDLGAPTTRAGGDAMASALRQLAHARLAGAQADLEQRAPLLDEYARDPVMRYLYGQSRQQSWAARADDADFVLQALREASREAQLLDDLHRAADAGQPARSRAEALIRLVDELALPWVIVVRPGRLDLLVRVADGDFAVRGIDGGTPELAPAGTLQPGQQRYPMFAGPVTPTLMLAAGESPAAPGVASNVWNGIGNNARKNWLTYAIIGGGGVAAALVAIAIPGAGLVASGMILKATVLSAGVQAWQDVNFGGLKGVARTYGSPDQIVRAERNLDYGETGVNVLLATYGLGKGVKGLVDAGEAAQQVRTAEQALARATQRAGVVSEMGEAQQRGWEVLRNVARTRDAVQAAERGVQYTEGMIKAQRTTSDILEGYQRSADAARQTLENLTQSAVQNLVAAGGRASVPAQGDLVTASGHLTAPARETLSSGQRAGASLATGDVIGAIGTASGPTEQALALLDSDKDGTPDSQDRCPGDPAKTAPGLCGCGFPDTDTDGDASPDCLDKCPADAAKREPGVCGCGKSDQDGDADGTPDCIDTCPQDPGKTEPGVCGCGAADTDGDGDGTPDCNDRCPSDASKVEPGVCGCGTADTDSDADGIPDCNDGCPVDANKVDAGICGCGKADTDSDGDGSPDCNDACPKDPNKLAPEICGCGVPDTDADGNGIVDCKQDKKTTTSCPENMVPTRDGGCVQRTDSGIAVRMHGAAQGQRQQPQVLGGLSTATGTRPGRFTGTQTGATDMLQSGATWGGATSDGATRHSGTGDATGGGQTTGQTAQPGTTTGTGSGSTTGTGTGATTGGQPTAGAQQKAWYGIEVVYSYKMSGTPCTNVTHKEAFMTKGEAEQLARQESANTSALLRSIGRTDIRLIQSGIYAGPSTAQPVYSGKYKTKCEQAARECESNAQCWSSHGSVQYYCNRNAGVCVKCSPGCHGKKDGSQACDCD